MLEHLPFGLHAKVFLRSRLPVSGRPEVSRFVLPSTKLNEPTCKNTASAQSGLQKCPSLLGDTSFVWHLLQFSCFLSTELFTVGLWSSGARFISKLSQPCTSSQDQRQLRLRRAEEARRRRKEVNTRTGKMHSLDKERQSELPGWTRNSTELSQTQQATQNEQQVRTKMLVSKVPPRGGWS